MKSGEVAAARQGHVRADDAAALRLEGAVEHEIVGIGEILDQQALGVAEFAAGRALDAMGRRDTLEQGRGIVGIGEDRLAQRGEKTQFEGRAKVSVDPAKGRQIEDSGVRYAHQRDIGRKDFLVHFFARRGREVMVERNKSDKAEFLAQAFLTQADRARVGQEDFGSGEVDFRIGQQTRALPLTKRWNSSRECSRSAKRPKAPNRAGYFCGCG